jgi:propanol-preferring alcohol dehydrogenase
LLTTFRTQPGQIGGHEGVGNIVKLGAGADAGGLKVGQRVGIKWVAKACGHCRKSGKPALSGAILT